MAPRRRRPSRWPRLTVADLRSPLVLVDPVVWVLALLGATWLRYDFGFTTASVPRLVLVLAGAVAVQAMVGAAVGLYNGRWARGSFDEAFALALTVGLVGGSTVAADLALERPVPLSATLGATPFAYLGMASLRWAQRNQAEKQLARDSARAPNRVVVLGAGDGGARIIDAMRRDPAHKYCPVALLDDDPAKARRRVQGVEVSGGRAALERVARAKQAEMLLIAIPSASPALISEMTERARAAGLTVRVLPTVAELIDGSVAVSDIRPVSYVDLLGRREVEVDLDSIAEYLTGRRVLVTGAGGSIGSELCRQVTRYDPASLVMLDRDESALHGVVLSIEARALLDDRRVVVADIRDKERLATVFDEHRPQVVFHAAALKHLPLLEMYPDEAVKTNVWGTLHLLELAESAGVERFVNISTDKAADPCSVLGYSKRVAERLASWYAAGSTTSFMSVRFGNVLGSRGSVLTTFQSQIAAGGPVTVTDPEVTRYFMTVEEAVRLVVQAGAFGSGGEALVLDMGEPVRIADVARRLIESSGRPCEVTFTGLRPGEKLDEVLVAGDEIDLRPVHPLISHVAVPALNPCDVTGLPVSSGPPAVAAALRRAASAAITLPHRRNLMSVDGRSVGVDLRLPDLPPVDSAGPVHSVDPVPEPPAADEPLPAAAEQR